MDIIDARTMFRLLEAQLWQAAKTLEPTYERGHYDGWVLCPRTHARAHLRCILDPAWVLRMSDVDLAPESSDLKRGSHGLFLRASELFALANRFHPGSDLVFAVGDVQ